VGPCLTPLDVAQGVPRSREVKWAKNIQDQKSRRSKDLIVGAKVRPTVGQTDYGHGALGAC